jgi:3-dehydroquinate synthase/shikimate kinase/3-dehydroquinate synthase|tara:strand:- start:220 stop:1326 length:1107 start_codon:yes stop_codon:yes gene_type:complete
MNNLIVKTKSKSYPIYFGQGIISSVNKLIEENLPDVKKVCIISDKKIPISSVKKINKLLKNHKTKIYRLNVNEKIKSFKFAYKIIEDLLKENFNRSDCIIALGGGVIGDLSSFIASLTKRGTKLINIPSTLLAQVDSSIGGKTAVNSSQGKNLVGTFYQPDFVIIDTSLLDSLPKREMICGYAEILKHSLILDKKFFLWLNQNAQKVINRKSKSILKTAILKSCKIKSKIVEKDEKEKSLRMVLNFGHTFAHGFEGAKNFTKKLNHGEAVLLGMFVASNLSYKKKLLSLKELNLITDHYNNLKLPSKLGSFFKKKDINKIIRFMQKDKKNFNNKINLILLKKIGLATKPNTMFFKQKEIRKILIENFH